MLIFRKSANLAAAYGMAVTGSMTITVDDDDDLLAHTNKKWKVPFAVVVFAASI